VSSTATPPGQGGDRCDLQVGIDRRLHRRARLGLGLGEDSGRAAFVFDRQQRAARLAGEARVEGLLETADADRGAGREPLAGQLHQIFLCGFADFAGDVDRGAAERVFAFGGGAFGQRRPVAGEDRRPRRQVDPVFEVLAGGEAGEDQARIPIDAAFVVGHLELGADVAEGDRARHDGHRDDLGAALVPRVLRRADFEAAQGRHLGGLAVGGRELVGADGAPRGFVQLSVHRGEVLVGPGRGEALRGFLLRRAGGARGGAESERDRRDDDQRHGTSDYPTTALHLGRQGVH